MAQQLDPAQLQKLQQQEEARQQNLTYENDVSKLNLKQTFALIQKRQQEDMIDSVLKAILSDEARARLNNIKLVKPEKAQQYTAALMQGAKMGKITNKISDAEFLKMMGTAASSVQETKVQFKRRTIDDDDW